MSKSPRHEVAIVVTIETAAVAGNWLITHSRWAITIAIVTKAMPSRDAVIVAAIAALQPETP